MNNIKDFMSRFGFHVTPFTCEIRVEERFVHEIYDEPLKYLQGAVDKRMCAALIAPAGTGKTFLLRTLTDRLPETRYRVHYVKVTELSRRDLCREIVTVVGAKPAGSYSALVYNLQERLKNYLDVDGLRPVLILDEAHDMRMDVLAILRILTNFDMDSRLVVSIMLVGQPPLSKLLRDSRLEEITCRLAHCATLRLLSRMEISQYIKHRCQIAGAISCPFDQSAMDALYEIGRGNLRATDYLALKSLEIVHDKNNDMVDADHVAQARRLLWP